MYLRKLHLVDVGPIEEAEIDMPFSDEGKPLPTVLLGTNGSGKSVALAVVTNALVAMQQLLFDNADVQSGKVYKLRSSRYIRAGADHYWCTALFDNGLQFSEWQLNTTRETFEKCLSPSRREAITARHGWGSMRDDQTSCAVHNFAASEDEVRAAWRTQVSLVFPAERHELPAWLNEEDLKYTAKFGGGPKVDRRTDRRVVRNVALKEVSDWLLDVALDARILSIPAPATGSTVPQFGGNGRSMERMALSILSTILEAAPGRALLSVGNRHARTVGRNFYDPGGTYLGTNTLLALSSGQANLFALFGTIMMDFDKTQANCNSMADVRGIVLIDEADMHLHVGLQATVLPKLIKEFPNVQFILTTHSPLLVLGLEREFGPAGVCLMRMPNGEAIRSEQFSEFDAAFSAIRATARYNEMALNLRNEVIPLLLTEGESDARLIEEAWRKLFPGTRRPFRTKNAVLETGESKTGGGAKFLNQQFMHISSVMDSAVLALFDHDKEGIDQHGGVFKRIAGVDSSDSDVRKHPTKPHWSMLLPIPEGRSAFRHLECGQLGKWHVEIEHYFPDQILLKYGLVEQEGEANAGRPFTIRDAAKMKFAKCIDDVPAEAFKEFKLLFDKLRAIGFLSS